MTKSVEMAGAEKAVSFPPAISQKNMSLIQVTFQLFFSLGSSEYSSVWYHDKLTNRY